MENEKEIIKIREQINKKFLQLDIDSDLHTAEEEKSIKNNITSLLCELMKYVRSTISGYFVPTAEKVYVVYELLEYEKTHDPLFIHEEVDHHYTLWPDKQNYENGTEKIAELKNEYELRDWLREMCA